MRAIYKTRNNRYSLEAAGDTVKDLFREMAGVQEVFEAAGRCGLCRSEVIELRVRAIDDNEFFEAVCMVCHAALSYGQKKKGGALFPKPPWRVYDPEEPKATGPAPAAAVRAAGPRKAA